MPTRRTFMAGALCAPLSLTLASRALAREAEIFSTGNMAINGADPVAYFDGKGPVAGLAGHRLMWRGAIWYFADDANLRAFERDPVRFAPAFGGYCAFKASRGRLSATSPEAWSLHGGRLYLMTDLPTRARWLQDVEGNIARAMENWPGILG